MGVRREAEAVATGIRLWVEGNPSRRGRISGNEERSEEVKHLFILLSILTFVYGQDSTKFKYGNLYLDGNWKLHFDATVIRQSDPVFRIDTTGDAFVPKGWERIIVIKDGQVWSADSSKTKISFPK